MKLCMGIEPAFYVDSGRVDSGRVDCDRVDCGHVNCGPPTFFAFDPCGHMATEKTVK